jgi:hypothetical protein
MDGRDRTLTTRRRRDLRQRAVTVLALAALTVWLLIPTGVSAASGQSPAEHITGSVQCHSGSSNQLVIGGPAMSALATQASTTVLVDADLRLSWDGTTWGAWAHGHRYDQMTLPRTRFTSWPSMTFSMPRYERSYVVQVRFRFHWLDNAAGWKTSTLAANMYETYAFGTYAVDGAGCVLG